MTFQSAYKCTLHTILVLVHDDEKLISGIFIQLLRQVSSSSLKHDGASKIEKWEGKRAKRKSSDDNIIEWAEQRERISENDKMIAIIRWREFKSAAYHEQIHIYHLLWQFVFPSGLWEVSTWRVCFWERMEMCKSADPERDCDSTWVWSSTLLLQEWRAIKHEERWQLVN